MSNKLLYIIIGSLLLLLFSVVIFSNLITSYIANRNTPQSNLSPSPILSGVMPTAVDLPAVKGQSIRNVPTLNPTEGIGLDLNSDEIKNSIAQIEKIKDKLPYKKTFTSTTGLKVDIFIPSYELLENQWTLTVNTLGIDFEITDESPDYEKTKTAFLEAARDIFFWLKNNDVNTEQIIIRWGDRAFIQTRAEEWLR